MAGMKILTYTTLYPSVARPHHGIFVEQRLRQVRCRFDVAVQVVAPVPWFPCPHARLGNYGAYARTPRTEERHGMPIWHPRYPVIPRVGMTPAPALLAAATLPVVRGIQARGFDFDFIDAHYFYPDGVAAAWIARRLRKPLIITARGTDINLIPRYPLPRRMILWAARQATAIVTVCQALKDELIALGVAAEKITTLRNGVDLELFRPLDRQQERARLGLTRPTLLSVGLLIERKGHHLAIEALTRLPDAELLIVGDGEQERRLKELARRLGVAGRVRFIGALPQEKLVSYYNAADALLLASSREGWANVLLEALACGTPVVATRIWGTPEVVSAPAAGVLVDERSAPALVDGVRTLFARYPERAAVRAHAERFGWEQTAVGQMALFEGIAGSPPP